MTTNTQIQSQAPEQSCVIEPALRALSLCLETMQWAADVIRQRPDRREDVIRVLGCERERALDIALQERPT